LPEYFGLVPSGEIERMIDNAYALVVKGLKKLERQGLELKYGQDSLYKK
jgi:predicted DNA-binding protein (MmcQ/YjbR family)